ncbi:hypothetical protein IW140_001023 [Coemansia sp. RSA 1813]|nr:hypothetical protein EV178_004240 [Coemansia sp. RSA 1646]KAJ1770769.1 hypothetical protein LPJ74_002900 [Coemansia sp. RSA 1843]KAJ2215173.1 hypothetical protein EV179_002392 [Coemansia sp. RSA 487]KAJ2572274.1 hypothetical protein IW140_001023 [Coemansia sp. RSA 1813]
MQQAESSDSMAAQHTIATVEAQGIDNGDLQIAPSAPKGKKHRKPYHKEEGHPKDVVTSVEAERKSKSKSKYKGKGKAKDDGSDPEEDNADSEDVTKTVNSGDEDNVCFICADTVKFYAVGECNHLTCFRCNLRLRALFKSNACPYCKADMDTVIHTSSPDEAFADLLNRPLPYADTNLNIKFDSKEAYDVAMHTLQFNCPHRKCKYVDSDGWKGLKNHARSVHTKIFCDLCLKNKKSFAEEHNLYTKAQLRVHYSRGDGVGFTGHPHCEFCNTSFYDNDQLFDHCRKKHEQCFICVRNETGRQVYYANYDTLEDHFSSTHFLCKDATCLQKKFVVFENEIDMQSHQLAEHGNARVGQRAKREAKQVNVNFQYTTARGDGSTSSSPSGRDRQRNSKQQPRTMTVNEPDTAGVSVAGRRRPAGFGRVTDNNIRHPAATRARKSTTTDSSSGPSTSEPEPEQEPELESLWPTLGSTSGEAQQGTRTPTTATRVTGPQAPSGFGRLSGNTNSSIETTNTAGVSEETMSLHQDLLQRVSAYLSHREQPVSRFRQLTTRYKDKQISAGDYVDNCWLLFLTVPEKNAKEMIQKTVKTVANLLPDPELKDNLTKALYNHRVRQQQFPALTPLNGTASPAGTLDNNQARVLVIKSKASNASTHNIDHTNESNDWPTPSSSPSSRSTTLRNRPSAQLAQRLSHVSSPLSAAPSAAFPSLGASSGSSPSLSSRMSQATISSRPNSSFNSYSGKFTGGVQRTVSASANTFASSSSQPNSEFPGLPPPSKTKIKIAPLNPNAKSAWSGSGLQSGSSSTRRK